MKKPFPYIAYKARTSKKRIEISSESLLSVTYIPQLTEVGAQERGLKWVMGWIKPVYLQASRSSFSDKRMGIFLLTTNRKRKSIPIATVFGIYSLIIAHPLYKSSSLVL